MNWAGLHIAKYVTPAALSTIILISRCFYGLLCGWNHHSVKQKIDILAFNPK